MAFNQQAAHSGNEIIATTGGQDQVAQLLKGAYSERATSWADAAFPAGTTSIDLDQVYPRIVKGLPSSRSNGPARSSSGGWRT